MPDELRKCPICGSDSYISRAGFVSCQNMTCYLFRFGLPIAEWQTRKLEDALQFEVDKLTKMVTDLESSIPSKIVPKKPTFVAKMDDVEEDV